MGWVVQEGFEGVSGRGQKRVWLRPLPVAVGSQVCVRETARWVRGASVFEIVDDFQTNTYRAVYTVKFGDAVYVPYAFQKKSKRGTVTPKAEIDLIKSRLKLAEEDHKARRKVSERGSSE